MNLRAACLLRLVSLFFFFFFLNLFFPLAIYFAWFLYFALIFVFSEFEMKCCSWHWYWDWYHKVTFEMLLLTLNNVTPPPPPQQQQQKFFNLLNPNTLSYVSKGASYANKHFGESKVSWTTVQVERCGKVLAIDCFFTRKIVWHVITWNPRLQVTFVVSLPKEQELKFVYFALVIKWHDTTTTAITKLLSNPMT